MLLRMLLQQQLFLMALDPTSAVDGAYAARALLAGISTMLWHGANRFASNASYSPEAYQRLLEMQKEAGLPNNSLLVSVLRIMAGEEQAAGNEEPEVPADTRPLTVEDYEMMSDALQAEGKQDDTPREDANGCAWWHFGMPRRSDMLCHSPAALHMHRALVAGAKQKALRCMASKPGSDCVLGH